MIIMEHNMLGEFQFFEAYTINVTIKRSNVYKEKSKLVYMQTKAT